MNNSYLIETLCAKHGVIQNTQWHIERVRRTLFALGGGDWRVIEEAMNYYEGDALSPLQRITFTYSNIGVLGVSALLYQHPHFSALALMEVSSDFSYTYKYANRELFNRHLNACSQGECPLFIRNGLLTDTHFSNIVLQTNEGLFTPHSPLLKGTMRERLLFEGTIHEKDLSIEDLYSADAVHLINSMNDIGDITIYQWHS